MASSHPRRRGYFKPAPSSVTPTGVDPSPSTAPTWTSINTSMPLRKGATFHSPTSPSEASDPILHVPSLPRRSPTCPRDLDAVVAAGKRRMAALISLSETGSLSTRAQLSRRGEDLPLPRGMLDATVSGSTAHTGATDVDCQPNNHPPTVKSPVKSRCRQPREAAKHHTSDSGIGSTISDSTQSHQEELLHGLSQFETLRSRGSSSTTNVQGSIHLSSASAIMRSLSAFGPSIEGEMKPLSAHATQQIQKHIIDPILFEPVLKDFHPLIRDMPRRINEREIYCLRDLEKTLFFHAQVRHICTLGMGDLTHSFCFDVKEKAQSPTAFLDFCEISIQCIHTAVDHLNERDQRRPTDKPYSNGYFLDLVGQVRRYADLMAASRERRDAEEREDEADYSPSEKVILKGGLSQTGRPAELVRVKEGKTIPIGDGPSAQHGDNDEEADESKFWPSPMKRTLSENSEDSARRSMARRRKLAPGEVVSEPSPIVCGQCRKHFPRRCDLTKHEKTHSRPWKCNESSCRYHNYGWPTEKERDRHVNDKHSYDPALYECLFKPCPYKSKRESNCKQHMEKAHGWEYVRAKGKKPLKKDLVQTPMTPPMDTPVSSKGPLTPHTGDASPMREPFNPFPGLSEPDYQYTDDQPEVDADAPSEYSQSLVNHGPLDLSLLHNHPEDPTSLFEASFVPSDMQPQSYQQNEIDWPTFHDLDVFNGQLSTPFSSTEERRHSAFSHVSDTNLPTSFHSSRSNANHLQNLSPAGKNVMLCSPYSGGDMVEDEGMDDTFSLAERPLKDFPLFPATDSSANGSLNTDGPQANMFQDLPGLSGDYLHTQFLNGEYTLTPQLLPHPPPTHPYLDMDLDEDDA
ncbi:MAG: copper-binding transcription factor [Sclerophora amabilis]|nr:MAG: copper-binding transcription factor [Sclerophora amabilis]